VQATTKYAAFDSVQIASPVFVDTLGGPLIPTPVILMQFNHNPSLKQVNALLHELDADPVNVQAWSALPGSYKVTSRSKNGFDIIAQANALSQRSDVRFAEPDMIFTGIGDGTPNDPGFSVCWGLHNTGQSGGVVDMDMDSLESWDITTGDASISVLIIDTGVQQDHPDINQIGGMDFTGEGGNGDPVNMCDNHGTPVAGCVSAIMNNNLGTLGSAPGVMSVSARCFISALDCSGGWSAYYSWTADALNWGLGIGVRVSNNSNGYGGTSSAVEAMYTSTRNAGMVHFASAGNDATSSIHYPSSLPTVNSVAALDIDGQLASFSNWGTGLAISAPGVWVYSTDRTGSDGYDSTDYSYVQGTSFASPYSAGVAALLLSIDASLTAAQVENAIHSSAIDLGSAGYDTTYGWGFINAYETLLTVVPTGACCVGTSICLDILESNCNAGGGTWLGPNTVCADGECKSPSCEADIDGNGSVDVGDLLDVIDAWGQVDSPADINADGIVNVSDLLIVIGNWGPCEQ
jgi:subtilisin family serine protease